MLFVHSTIKWILEVGWNCIGVNAQIYKSLTIFLHRWIHEDWKINYTIDKIYIWTQLFAYLHKSFILTIISLIRRLLQLGRIRKSKLVLPLTRLCSSHNPSFKCSYFHDLDKFGKLCSCLVPYAVIRFTILNLGIT